MNTAKTVAGKVAALAMLPSLSLGLFAAPALAFNDGGNTTRVHVGNYNTATVVNAIKVSSNSGRNTANGGDAAAGGNSGVSGSRAGNGGEGGDAGNGGKAEVEGGHGDGYAEGGDGGYGAPGGAGGSTGNTGRGGAGGDGGEGGYISTGDASAALVVSNDVNTNKTDVEVSDCGCDQYNTYYEAADTYYKQSRSHDRDWYQEGRRGASGGSKSGDKQTVKEDHWMVESTEYVPVTTVVGVHNLNDATVANLGAASANSGGNTANGGDGSKGGKSGNSGSDAGYGGEGGAAGNGGNAEVESKYGHTYKHYVKGHHDHGTKGEAIGGDAADGGAGAEGGSTGNTGAAGNGGNGALGGVIVTGRADTAAAVLTVSNRNVTRIVR